MFRWIFKKLFSKILSIFVHYCLIRKIRKSHFQLCNSVLTGGAVFQHSMILEMSDLDVYISKTFLVSSKTNLTELFQDISIRTIIYPLLPYSVRNVDGPGSDDSYLKKSYGTFVRPIIFGGIIGTNCITLFGDHWMLPHKRTAIGLDTFILSCNTPPYLPLKINRNTGNTISFNEDTITSTE